MAHVRAKVLLRSELRFVFLELNEVFLDFFGALFRPFFPFEVEDSYGVRGHGDDNLTKFLAFFFVVYLGDVVLRVKEESEVTEQKLCFWFPVCFSGSISKFSLNFVGLSNGRDCIYFH